MKKLILKWLGFGELVQRLEEVNKQILQLAAEKHEGATEEFDGRLDELENEIASVREDMGNEFVRDDDIDDKIQEGVEEHGLSSDWVEEQVAEKVDEKLEELNLEEMKESIDKLNAAIVQLTTGKSVTWTEAELNEQIKKVLQKAFSN